MTTALTLVNNVLREMREAQVTDFSATYSLFILQQINKAKQIIENVRPWPCLRSVITFNTVSGTETYNMGTGGVGTGGPTTERSYLVMDECQNAMIYDTTSKTQLIVAPAEIMRGYSQLALTPNSPPSQVSLIPSATGITVRFYPKPNGAYAISSTWVIPQADLSATTDVLTIPSTPVWLLAASYCAGERGDGMGDAAGRLADQAREALNDAIQYGTDINELTCYPD